MRLEVLNDQDVPWGIGKGHALVHHSVNGQRPKYLAVLWNPKKLSGTHEMLNDTDWQWMTCKILIDIEWLGIY